MSGSRAKRKVEPLSVNDQSGPISDNQDFPKVNTRSRADFPDHIEALYRRHVIIVEDEATIGFALELELSEAGAVPVGPANSLLKALDFLDAERVDGAILDIDLSGVDVFPLADLLIDKGICFVFHTAHGRREELRDVYPNVPICSKPASPSAVLKTLGKAFSDRTRN